MTDKIENTDQPVNESAATTEIPAADPQAPSGSDENKTLAQAADAVDSAPENLEDPYEGAFADTRTKVMHTEDLLNKEKAAARRQLKISCHRCLQKLDVTYLEPFAHFNCPACNGDLIVPKWFDNYLLEEPGGIGGMARVYRALDLALDREVAIKVLNPEVANEKERNELFLHEARTAATINHYAVIPIYTCGTFEEQPYIVMQYMAGGSLEEKLTAGKGLIPVNDVLQWMRDVAEGLDNASRHGIIHHDIKPGNIMLDPDGNAKVGDFGIAQALRDTRAEKVFELTKSWISPHYVSPEKVLSGKEDARGDIYSLGATFYNLITGFTPYDHNDVDELIKLRLQKDPVAPHQHRSEIPSEISRLILSMMFRDPEKRPSYREIVKTLNTCLKNRGGEPSPKKKVLVKSQGGSETQRKMARKKSVFAYVYYAVLWAVIITGIYYAWKTGRLQPLIDMVWKKTEAAPEDNLPQASAAFAQGDLKKAREIAQDALDNVNANPATRRQAALQLAIAYYLEKDPKAKDHCSYIAEQVQALQEQKEANTDNTEEPDTLSAIIMFLANPEIKPEEFESTVLKDNDKLRVAGLLAIFLRQAYDGAPRNLIIKDYMVFLSSASVEPETNWANAWKKRLEVWTPCVQSSVGSEDKLEPLIAGLLKVKRDAAALPPGNSTTAAVSAPATQSNSQQKQVPKPTSQSGNLNASWLASDRAFAKARPQPADFSLPTDLVSAYLAKLPQGRKDAEQQRSKIVSSFRDNLCRTMLRFPYQGDVIKLKDGKQLKGTLMASPEKLSLRDDSGKRHNFKWSDLPASQLKDFAAHYIKIRTEAGADTEQKKEAAREYLHLAVFCDWYGMYADCAAYGKKAQDTDPSISAEVNQCLLR